MTFGPERLQAITSREDFIRFVEDLSWEFKERRDTWENITLDQYLLALSSWVRDMDGYFANVGEDAPTDVPWRFFAQVLTAASIYE